MKAINEIRIICIVILSMFIYFQGTLFILKTFDLFEMGMAGWLFATMILFCIVYVVSLVVRVVFNK